MYLVERNADGILKLVEGVSNSSINSSTKPIITDGEGRLDPSLFSPLTFTGRYIEYNVRNLSVESELTINSPTINYINLIFGDINLILPNATTCDGRLFSIVNATSGDNKVLHLVSSGSNFLSLDNGFYTTIQSTNGVWRKLVVSSIDIDYSTTITSFPTTLTNDSPRYIYLNPNSPNSVLNLSSVVRDNKYISIINVSNYTVELTVDQLSIQVFIDPKGVIDCHFYNNEWNLYIKY